MVTVTYRHVRGHVEVFIDGAFYCSADTMAEAHNEVKEFNEEDKR